MTERVLVVVAHPDDEVLMCGGTIAKHVAAGDEVHVLVVADGVTSREGSNGDDRMERLGAFRVVSELLNFNEWALGFPDQQLDTIPRLVLIKAIEKRMAISKPTIVYTHWHKDMNLDHRIVSDATMVACRPQPGCSVKRILMGEIPSSTEWAGGFNPNWFVEISFDKKLEALQCYEPEMRKMPHPRSYPNVLALANLRGAQAGVILAEAFELARGIA